MIEVTRCPLCSNERSAFFESAQDSGHTLTYSICRHCGLVYQNPRLDPKALSSLYEGEYRVLVQGTEEPCIKDLRTQLARAYNLARIAGGVIGRVSRHLDIGASSGALLAVFADRFGCESVGVEPGIAYANFARSKGLRMYPDLEELAKADPGRFDLVSLSHVLEHFVDPVERLVELRERFLMPGGHLLVEVPNVFGHNSLELTHLTAFAPSSLRDTLCRAGMQTAFSRVHGRPRSDALGLYITVIARADEPPRPYTVPQRRPGLVKLRRRLGMLKLRLLSRWLPALAWKELADKDTIWPAAKALQAAIVLALGCWLSQLGHVREILS